ncbi:GNAT family N-acetyltransferase [Streptomyces sp. NPDC000070]|uniref:GNAT family N-acetyltransferase n=1 Tax=Streptomyces sp. NPDC000070 TaxID=3154240 RepID=UPI003323F386
MPPTLRTARLFLDAYTPDDEDDFVALFQDSRVSRWMGDGPAAEADDRALFGRIFTRSSMPWPPQAWGSGLGTELAEALVGYGFDVLGLTEVHATVAARNEASLRLLGRLGFAYVRDVEEDDGGLTRVLTRTPR